MHTRSKGCARIDMDDHFIPVFRLYFLPGRDDQNVVHIELFEILFPVVDPVLVLCLRLYDGALSKVQELLHFCKCRADICKNLLLVLIHIEVKIQVGNAVVIRNIRHDIYEHLLFVALGQRLFVLNFHAFDSHIGQSRDHNIFHFRSCF